MVRLSLLYAFGPACHADSSSPAPHLPKHQSLDSLATRCDFCTARNEADQPGVFSLTKLAVGFPQRAVRHPATSASRFLEVELFCSTQSSSVFNSVPGLRVISPPSRSRQLCAPTWPVKHAQRLRGTAAISEGARQCSLQDARWASKLCGITMHLPFFSLPSIVAERRSHYADRLPHHHVHGVAVRRVGHPRMEDDALRVGSRAHWCGGDAPLGMQRSVCTAHSVRARRANRRGRPRRVPFQVGRYSASALVSCIRERN